ncbi:paraquat-inducible protein A [Catenovulum adriaticum]|uniref:Paraquat-inducible protein A n=1 Tax=Catenovulum adriaticum TaxID=2984846 RepID=A0ABY7ARA2_9ALTE|nr:paraquat-inducible protein A [Catenovulum sp. TS8]WAJ70781.1 paraquat-inducible protein A [Catenovulum sp. TS8]
MKQMACKFCDCLFDAPAISHNEAAFCPMCKQKLIQRPKYSLQFCLSFAIASLFLFVLSNVFTFLAIDAQGQYHQMLLAEASFVFWQYDQVLLAILVLLVVLLIPLGLIISLIYILWPLLFQRKIAVGTCRLARIIFQLKNWSMVEVYLVAVLASLTKLTALASIEFGIGLWGYISFTICLSATLTNLDRHRFWRYLDKVKCHQNLKQQNQNT